MLSPKPRYADGTTVEYYSSQDGGWILAKVLGFTEEGHYRLDVQPNAKPEKVRLPVASISSGGTQYAPNTPVEYRSASCDKSTDAKVLGVDEQGCHVPDVDAEVPPDKVRLPEATGVPSHGDAVPVRTFFGAPAPAPVFRAKSEDEPKPRYADGTTVEYYSSQNGGWIRAKVLGFTEEGHYRLDVQPNAKPEKVRLPVAAPVPEMNLETRSSVYTRDTFTKLGGLLAPVEEDALAPIRGKYLLGVLEEGGSLVRRQELPPAAFWRAPALRDAAVALDQDIKPGFKGFANLFVALSYRWISADHPDPDGHHLKIVCRAIRFFLKSVDDIALFWDFGSLFQNPDRTSEQSVLFKKGLMGCNVWYGHQQSTVWLQSCMPGGFSGMSYDISGWCFVEATVSSAIKATNKRFDLGAPTGCRVPLSPQQVAQLLKHEKRFTNHADISHVVAMYEQFFTVVASETALSFSKAQWNAGHVRELAEVLPQFVHAAELDLSHNDIASDGAQALANLLSVSRSVTDFNLRGNNMGNRGVDAIAGVLKKHTSLRLLNPGENGILEKGAEVLAGVLKENRSITHLELRFNNIGDRGVAVLATALHVNRSISHLNLRMCCIGDVGAQALAAALKANTSLETLDLSENGIGDHGKEALVAAVQLNRTVKNLRLPHSEGGCLLWCP